MASECGLPYEHPKHLDSKDGIIFKCDGDPDKRPNYDGSAANKPGY